MPIPFILGAIAVGTGLFGAAKAIEASDTNDCAKWNNERAQEIVEEAQSKVEKGQKAASEEIQELGKTKIKVMSTDMKDFVENFSLLKNVQFKDSEGLEELKKFNPNNPEFQKLKEATLEASDIAAGGLGAVAGGTLLAAGTYGAVMGGGFAVASTGAGIAGLSGVAATNATLAWLGGGSLAAGGFGMAGGMAVLGGLVAGPLLAIGGSFFSAKADEAYAQSQENREKADEFAEKCKNVNAVLVAIKKRASQITDIIDEVDTYFSVSVDNLKGIIAEDGVDFSSYSEIQKKDVYKSVQLAKTMKIILDTSLLTEKGELSAESEKMVKDARKQLATSEIFE